MKRTAALVVLLAVAFAAGVWLVPTRTRTVEPADSCDGGGVCTADIDGNEPAPAPETQTDTEAPAVSSTPPDAAVAETKPTPRPAPAAPPSAGAVVLREQADKFLAEGQILEAITALRAATKADPSARNHGDLGELLYKTLSLDEALIHLRKAAELDAGNADRWITLANAYYRKVDLGKAWDAERRAKQAEPGLVLGYDQGGRRVRTNAAEPPTPSPNE